MYQRSGRPHRGRARGSQFGGGNNWSRGQNSSGRGPYNDDGEYVSNNWRRPERSKSRGGEQRGGGRGRHPPHLKGRDIGLWYAQFSKEKKPELPELSMKQGETQHWNRMLDSLDGSDGLGNNRDLQARLASRDEATTSNVKREADETAEFDSFSNPEAWISGEDQKQKEHESTTNTFTRTIDNMKETAFKEAYVNNVRANQEKQADEAIMVKYEHRQQRNATIDEMLQVELQNQREGTKYKQMMKFRQKLPSYEMKDEIVQFVNTNQVVVLSGETGCGKTTQVPQFILESEIDAGRGSVCHIICTQPRRISAISVAQRVADERGEKLGKSVGYQIRLEACKARDHGSVMFCTTGIVLQWLQGDPLLSSVSHLVLDEIHERDMQSDFLIAITKDLLPRRPDLKIILMSATLNSQTFSTYFGDCPMVHIPGFTYPVTEFYLEDVLELTRFQIPAPYRQDKSYDSEFAGMIAPWVRDQKSRGNMRPSVAYELLKPYSEKLCLDLIVSLLQHICRQPPGGVLVFLPGWGEISSLNTLINNDDVLSRFRTKVIPLHSLMPTCNQREVFDRPPSGVRKIVLATNIAETSITIDDIVYVIDGGYTKMTRFNKESNLVTLQPEFVTLANARQRRGRAGRVQEGTCYHLYTRGRELILDAYPLPEILRTRLEEIILHIKILKFGLVKPFLEKLMESPDEDIIDKSLQLLQAINALDEDENLTPLGFHLAKLPVDPLTGRMLLMAAIFSCVDPILTIAATLSFKDPFIIPLGKEKEVDQIKKEFSVGTKSDHLMFVKVFDSWREASQSGNEKNFCWRNYLSNSVLQQLSNMRDQFFGLIKDHKFINPSVRSYDESVNKNSANILVIKALVTSGLYPNVAHVRINQKRGRSNPHKPLKMRTASDRAVFLHPKCVCDKDRDLTSSWMVYREKMKSTKVYIYDASNVFSYPLLLFGQRLSYNEDQKVIDVDGFVKVKCSKEVADIIRKFRKELDTLLEYKISHPGVTEWGSREGRVLEGIVELLSSEDQQTRCHEDYYDDNNADEDEY